VSVTANRGVQTPVPIVGSSAICSLGLRYSSDMSLASDESVSHGDHVRAITDGPRSLKNPQTCGTRTRWTFSASHFFASHFRPGTHFSSPTTSSQMAFPTVGSPARTM
jgi:hypothetical protein